MGNRLVVQGHGGGVENRLVVQGEDMGVMWGIG